MSRQREPNPKLTRHETKNLNQHALDRLLTLVADHTQQRVKLALREKVY